MLVYTNVLSRDASSGRKRPPFSELPNHTSRLHWGTLLADQPQQAKPRKRPQATEGHLVRLTFIDLSFALRPPQSGRLGPSPQIRGGDLGVHPSSQVWTKCEQRQPQELLAG